MILFIWNAQKRQINGDRKQISDCLGLGTGREINCKRGRRDLIGVSKMF